MLLNLALIESILYCIENVFEEQIKPGFVWEKHINMRSPKLSNSIVFFLLLFASMKFKRTLIHEQMDIKIDISAVVKIWRRRKKSCELRWSLIAESQVRYNWIFIAELNCFRCFWFKFCSKFFLGFLSLFTEELCIAFFRCSSETYTFFSCQKNHSKVSAIS